MENRLPSDLVADAQPLRHDASQGEIPFANGYSELVIRNCQDASREDKEGQCTTIAMLERPSTVNTSPETIQTSFTTTNTTSSDPGIPLGLENYNSVKILQNGGRIQSDFSLLQSHGDSGGQSTQNDPMPALCVSDTAPMNIDPSKGRCKTDLSENSMLSLAVQPSEAKNSKIDNVVCQNVTAVNSTKVVGDSCATVASLSTISGNSERNTTSKLCTTAVSSGHDLVTNAVSTSGTSSYGDGATVATCTSVAIGNDCVLTCASSSLVVKSEAAACPNERHLNETLPQNDKESCSKSKENCSATTEQDFVRTRQLANSKQRYSDVPLLGIRESLLEGNLSHDTHSCIQLSYESPKKCVLEEKSKGVEVSSCGVHPCPEPISHSVVSGIDSRGEGIQERTSTEDPLLKKRYDRRSVTSISSDSRVETRSDLPPISPGCIIMSHSTEKITSHPNARMQFFPSGGIVRSSRSQENYFDSGDITCVDIDLDDNIASSVDALHYDTSSMASLDSMGVPDWPIDDSEPDLYLQVDKKCFKGSEPDRASLPAVLSAGETHSTSSAMKCGLSDSVLQTKSSVLGPISQSKPKSAVPTMTTRTDDVQRSAGAHGIAMSINSAEIEDAFGIHHSRDTSDNASPNIPLLSHDEAKPTVPGQKGSTGSAPGQSVTSVAHRDLTPESLSKTDVALHGQTLTDTLRADKDEDMEDIGDGDRIDDVEFMFRDDTFFRQPTKDVDRPSAARLAKRLFYLHGFKKSDVSRHLSKKNSFSQLVGEEYLKFFDFCGEPLDVALRRFMKHMTIYGETQDRERLLAHFSCRYQQCNPDTFKSEDCCHTLACALLLLNNDLNGQNIGRKITLVEFISNLADMNDGEQFPKELLKSLYQSIKNQPLEFEAEELNDATSSSSGLAAAATSQNVVPTQSRFVSYNPFYDIPDPTNAVEFKKGYVMRKCCLEPDGRKTPLGKRGWKMFYATLRDMVLHLHIDEHGFKRNQHYTSASNAIHIHHSLATKATDYQKKNHVFRLQTADMAQYLIQTSDSKECQEWIDAINFVAASYSAPSPISSITSQKRFQRPLLPSTYTRLNLREQISHHEKMITELDREFMEHRKYPPEKGAKTRLIQDYCKKESYLKLELKRYKTYCRLLQYKVSTFPELEPSLAEIAIGEVDEPTVSGSSPVESPFDGHGPKFFQSSPTSI